MIKSTIAQRIQLPCTVPPGGLAVVLADGRVAREGVQGPGNLKPDAWRGQGKHLEVVVFPASHLRLAFEVPELPTAEGIRLDLRVDLSLQIENPVQFLTDVVQDAGQLGEAELADLLRAPVHTALADALRRRTLADLDSDANLRAWLGTVIEGYLTTEADLLGRSGLTVLGVDAFDLRCRVRDEQRQVQESFYLRTTLAEAEAEGRRLLDQRLLSQLRAHLPDKEELVEHQRRMADLIEQQVEVEDRIGASREQRQQRMQAWIAAQDSRPSSLRPELWRRDLKEPVRTAPLADEQRIYVATKGGRVLAFDRETGEPAWPQPAELGVRPGEALAMAADRLWVPGHDGVLYGLDPTSGAEVHRVEIGGRLSSAPLVVGNRLYLGVDVDAVESRPGAGDVVAVDAVRGAIVQRWPVSKRGLRAQPALWGETLLIGDRSGGFHALDLRNGRVETWPVRGGRILAPALIDETRGQIFVGDSYGRVLAFDRTGRERWSARLGGAIVGQPLLHRGTLFVGASDGRVYALDPRNGRMVRDPFQARDAVAAPPVAWHHLVLASSNDGYLYALEVESGRPFWQYHSGSPVMVPPAVTPEGWLYVVDGAGHLNALRWCLARHAEGARHAEDADPPRLKEAIELWMMAGEAEAALEAAKRAGRPDWEAGLAMQLHWYDRAAHGYQRLAGQERSPAKAARWWAEAALAWELAGQDGRADRCRRLDADKRGAPLLDLHTANLPVLTLGQRDLVQVCVSNCTDALACDVRLAYEGHVQRAGEQRLGSLGPRAERMVEIEVVPTESGSAMLRVTTAYSDSKGRPQRPVPLEVRLKVAQPPEVHHHYYGPHVGRDGVIILRGESGGRGRSIRVQSGDDAIELGRGQAQDCEDCAVSRAAGYPHCMGCGKRLD